MAWEHPYHISGIRRAWANEQKRGRRLLQARALSLYSLELDAGLPRNWRKRIAAALDVQPDTVGRYLTDARREAQAELAAGRSCWLCGHHGYAPGYSPDEVARATSTAKPAVPGEADPAKPKRHSHGKGKGLTM